MNLCSRIGYIIVIIMLATASCSTDEPKTDYPTGGLISYFNFDNNKSDVMGNSPDWVSTGGVAFVETFMGEGLLFNGINGSVTVDRASFHTDNQYSISFWFKAPDDKNNSPFLICQDFQFRMLNSLLYHDTTIPDQPTTITVFDDWIWTHVVGIFDGNYVKTFINGFLYSQRYSPGIIPTGTQDLTIGRFNNAYWEGQLDELFIYDRALTQKEVTQLYER